MPVAIGRRSYPAPLIPAGVSPPPRPAGGHCMRRPAKTGRRPFWMRNDSDPIELAGLTTSRSHCREWRQSCVQHFDDDDTRPPFRRTQRTGWNGAVGEMSMSREVAGLDLVPGYRHDDHLFVELKVNVASSNVGPVAARSGSSFRKHLEGLATALETATQDREEPRATPHLDFSSTPTT